ncbi:hypothetical protein, partial [Bacteroides mediterraneensis]|uniref:hypothetical protein n=1 Tax=Bacteroides mediterraneensis TaxID=1841856 RepID=UPI0026EA7C2B
AGERFSMLSKGAEKTLHYIFRAGACTRMCKTRTAGTFLPETHDIFYVFLSGNVCFRPEKRTFPGRKTYVSPDGNIENLNTTKDYLTDKSFISLFIIERLQHLYITNDTEAPTN